MSATAVILGAQARGAKRTHLSMELAEDGENPGRNHDDNELVTGANKGREKAEVLGAPKNVTVHLFPAAVFAYAVEPLQVVVVPGVACVVIPESAQEDETDKTTKENNHHEAVEDAEPVNLMLEEIVVEVPLEASREQLGRWNPFN